LARSGQWQRSRLGKDVLSLQRRGVSLRRVLHIERVEYAKEPWQSRKASAAYRRQLHGITANARRSKDQV
jgi:hypothetical protein